MRHSRHHRQHEHNSSGGVENRRACQQLITHVMGDITVIADAGDDNRRRGGEQQGRDLRHQPIADSHQHILLEGGVGAQVVFEDADTDAADQVDRQNHHPGDGVPAHKF
ncbi:hypothetical protein ExPCM18_00713 [Escherichia coli]|nr:hypothetical protein ExPCM18_00713 [Escherichia coli]CAD5571318.1 Uncharacterised protein [Escherichia coli]